MSKDELSREEPESRTIRGSAEVCQAESGTVLVIEDEEMLRLAVAKVLRKRGFTVIEAAYGNAGVDLFLANRSRIDVVLLDLTLPGKMGAAVLDELQRIQPEVRVIFMSGYTDSFIAGHGVLQEGTNLLHKPFTEEVLINKVREVLDGAKKALPASKAELDHVGSSSPSRP